MDQFEVCTTCRMVTPLEVVGEAQVCAYCHN